MIKAYTHVKCQNPLIVHLIHEIKMKILNEVLMKARSTRPNHCEHICTQHVDSNTIRSKEISQTKAVGIQ